MSHRLVTYTRDFGISLGHAPARSRGQHGAGCLTVTIGIRKCIPFIIISGNKAYFIYSYVGSRGVISSSIKINIVNIEVISS